MTEDQYELIQARLQTLIKYAAVAKDLVEQVEVEIQTLSGVLAELKTMDSGFTLADQAIQTMGGTTTEAPGEA